MTKNWIKYWRNSLADSERMERDVSKMESYHFDALNLSSGTLPITETIALIDNHEKKTNRLRGVEDPNDLDWISINQVPLVIAPFALLPYYEHAKKIDESQKIYPFWINALGDRSGQLIIPESRFPTFIRRCLEPAALEDQNICISSIERVDEAMAEEVPSLDSWKDYIDFIYSFFEKITGYNLSNYQPTNVVRLDEFIVAIDTNIEGMANGIIKLYDYLVELQDPIPLFENLSNIKGNELGLLIDEAKWPTLIHEHVGQMGDSFPISNSQRQSLHHYTTLKDGDVLAVNGPPGTGKTTLLQSIVANEFVKAAIKGQQPTIILAASTNNQAVTNIIDSFGKSDSRQGILSERWLPKINSYALFLPSSLAKFREGILYARNGQGLPNEIENSEYIQKAKEFYLSRFKMWSNYDFEHIKEATDFLRRELVNTCSVISESVEEWNAYLQIEQQIEEYSEAQNTEKYYQDTGLNKQNLENDKKEYDRLLNDYYLIKERESFWIILFSCLKFVREKRSIPYKKLMRSTFLNLPKFDFQKFDKIETHLQKKLDLINAINATARKWESWKKKNKISSNPPKLFDEFDVGYRHKAFLLATHYWEGRWILETELAIEEDIIGKSGEPKMVRMFQRYAMLTPCFVATFYMAPKFFYYTKYIEGSFVKCPLLNFVDLLIVDEAGQVTPEVGAASFALAKKALVVGDIKQIDPIWSIPGGIDESNLHKFELLTANNSIESIEAGGFSVANGSVMKMSQNASFYQVSSKEAKGMLLVEHRRCFNEIVQYCNDLAYHGLLKPLRGSSQTHNQSRKIEGKREYPIPPLSYFDVEGESRTENGSRYNEQEAIAIANWLLQNRESILSFYQERAKIFEDYVAVVTPFTSQKSLIKRVLKKAGFNTKRLTVGTVHALQGAERPIILFSTVYASNETSRSFFFDRGVNMLNVAVSRAKDAFVLFADLSILDETASSPSGKLIRYLKKTGLKSGIES